MPMGEGGVEVLKKTVSEFEDLFVSIYVSYMRCKVGLAFFKHSVAFSLSSDLIIQLAECGQTTIDPVRFRFVRF